MLFIMRGATCSGKDTFIDATFGVNCDHVISSDKIRVMLTGDMSKQDYNARVFELMGEMLETRLLNGAEYTVINATNLRMKDAKRFIELGKEHHSKMIMLSIQPPGINELIQRSIDREAGGGLGIPEGVVRKHFERYESCKPPFVKEATYNKLFEFIEVGQDYEVIRHVHD